MIAFAITAKIYPHNIALTTSIIETSLNLAVAFSPFLGGVFYEVGLPRVDLVEHASITISMITNKIFLL